MTTTNKSVRTKAQEFEGQLDEGLLADPGVRPWCHENRALIARALRRDEAIESPTYEVAVAIGQAVESPGDHAGWDDRGFAALDALGKALP